jgi:hypothetical protein
MRGLNIGGSSILVIFVLISLVTLATLSLLSSMNTLRMANNVANFSVEHFAAYARAEEMLAEINHIVSTYAANDIPDRLDTIGVNFEDTIISYTVPINQGANLEVVLNFNMPSRELSIEGWATYMDYDQTQFGQDLAPVWQGHATE